jgi:hypothetical protein
MAKAWWSFEFKVLHERYGKTVTRYVTQPNGGVILEVDLALLQDGMRGSVVVTGLIPAGYPFQRPILAPVDRAGVLAREQMLQLSQCLRGASAQAAAAGGPAVLFSIECAISLFSGMLTGPQQAPNGASISTSQGDPTHDAMDENREIATVSIGSAYEDSNPQHLETCVQVPVAAKGRFSDLRSSLEMLAQKECPPGIVLSKTVSWPPEQHCENLSEKSVNSMCSTKSSPFSTVDTTSETAPSFGSNRSSPVRALRKQLSCGIRSSCSTIDTYSESSSDSSDSSDSSLVFFG